MMRYRLFASIQPRLLAVLICCSILLVPNQGRTQANLLIYTNDLVNGFQDWSWASDDLSCPSPVRSGTYSISVSGALGTALSFYHADFDTSLYSNLSFLINGGAGGQVLTVQAQLGEVNTPNPYNLPALSANTWKLVTIPLSSLGVANKTNFDRFWIQYAGGTTNTFYVDDIQLTAKPAPALTHINLNVAQTLGTADARWFGVNTAIWDSYFTGGTNTANTESLLKEAGLLALRFPGGSASDEYHWASNTSLTNTWTWSTPFSAFAPVATNVGAEVFITVNYGTGTPGEAAAWVKNSNVTNHYGFKYWEIGNEVYGTWETDSNSLPNDPYTYAVRAQAYIQQMKTADPTIKIGVVVTPGETSFANYTNHGAYNPRTGQTNYGWTAVLLSTLKTLGVTPDFAIHHRYPEYTDGESDPLLLQNSTGWADDAADLRQQISDYFGAGGANIELLCTENNSNSGAQGKQSTSLVNGLYYMDSLCQLMKTEFHSLLWWDWRNGIDNTGNLDPTLYGWRLYGDMGLVDGSGGALTNRYPTYYAAKLMQYFARPGDTVLNATSDYALLSAYAARRADGSLSLLVIHKDPTTNFTAQIAVAGFSPDVNATLRSYGMPQDNAAETGVGSPDLFQTNIAVAGATFEYTFAPYSATVISLSPAPPSLVALPGTSSSNTQVLQLRGQAGVPYVLQSSTNLVTWNSVSTNLLTSSSLNITNTSLPAVAHFWRAVWVP